MARPPTSGTTERIVIAVKGKVADWQEPLRRFLLTLKDQPGVIRHRWGPWTEDPNKLEILVGWTTDGALRAFRQSEAYAEALKGMAPVLSGPLQAFQIRLEPYAPKYTIDSVVVQLVTISGCDDQDDDRLRAQFMQVTAMDGCYGATCGFSTEPVDVGHLAAGGGANGTKPHQPPGRVWVGISGWTSLAKSDEAERPVYVPDCGTKTEIHHANFNFPIKGFSVTNSIH